jgi:threonine dehydrogenase-like Zn-dependent dehydrogenase
MRAAVLRGRKVETRETADPVPGEGQLLLKVLSCAICASDLHFMDNPEAVADDDSGLWDYQEDADIVMGHEFVGEIVGHGPSVDTAAFPLGARVTSLPVLNVGGVHRIIGCSPAAPGGFGEYMLVQDMFARVVPDDVLVDHAALADAFAVGEYYVRNSAITNDGSIIPVVIGAGAIGLSAVAALARRGVTPIVVADYTPTRLDTAKALGATHCVDPRERSPYEVWKELALGDREAPSLVELNHGGAEPIPGCNVYEFVGHPGVLDGIVADCPPDTRIFTAGGAPEGDHISSATAKKKGIVIHFGGGPKHQDWYGTLDAVVAGSLDPSPVIGMVVDLDGVPEAIDLARRADGPARIMIHPFGDA